MLVEDTGIGFACKSQSYASIGDDNNPSGSAISFVKSSGRGNCVVRYDRASGFRILGEHI